MPEPPLYPQTIHRHLQEIVAHVEGANDKGGWSEEPRCVGGYPLARCRPPQTLQDARRMTERICIRVDREHACVLSVRVAERASGVDQSLSRFGSRIDPPGT